MLVSANHKYDEGLQQAILKKQVAFLVIINPLCGEVALSLYELVI